MTYLDLTESTLCDLLYTDPNIDFSRINIKDPDIYNNSVKSFSLNSPLLRKTPEDLEIDDLSLQSQWLMPKEYYDFNLVEWLFNKCNTDKAKDRIEQELKIYIKLEAYDLLLYLKYLVDTMLANNIVWGVGRGSSVSSYVLYLIGVHHIDSLKYNLDIKEFLKESS